MKKNLPEQIAIKFRAEFKAKPIVVKSPGRINLIGEHTDYNEGFVFPAAIDKGIISAIQKSEADYCTAIAVDEDERFDFSLENIQPLEDGGWRNYVLGVVAEIQKAGVKLTPFNIVIGGDIPIGAGLSSSAALENSVVFGLNEVFKLELSRKAMVFISQKAEHNYAFVRCGIMDMYASMFGKEKSALLLDCRAIESKEFHIDLGDYQLLLINTNVKHSLSESAYNDRRLVCEKAAALLHIPALRDASEADLKGIKPELSEEEYQKALYVIQENKRVEQAAVMIVKNDIVGLGQLLYETHNGLQNQYKVSCDELDFLVEQSKENPEVIGARMMGGGFGGCTLNIVAKHAVEAFSERIAIAYKSKFNKECTFYSVSLSQGTHLVK